MSGFKPNIYNISSNYRFFESFFEFLSHNFAKNSDLTIFFPNKRSCREFIDLLKKNPQNNGFKPKIKAIAEISAQDFLDFFPANEVVDIVEKIGKINHLSDLDYLFFLSEEIIKTDTFGKNIDFSYAMNIATQLKKLFDEIEINEINLDELHEVDDSNLAQHRQFTLDFLKKFYVKIKNQTLKNNVFSTIARQHFVICEFAKIIEKYGLKSHLIIAGSTGSVSYSKKLIKAISAQKNGHVVLCGLDQEREVFADERDPQFILNELINFIEIAKKDIKKIAIEKFKMCDNNRLHLVFSALLPSDETYKWQDFKVQNDAELLKDFQNNFSYFEAKNEIEEAQIIAIKAFEAAKENKKIAIIVNESQFANLIKSELKKFTFDFNDSRSLDLSDSRLIKMILLLLDLIRNDFESATLLAVLKHPYSRYLKEGVALKNFEIEVLRQQRKSSGILGIKEKANLQSVEVQGFFNNFYSDIEGLASINIGATLGDYLKNIITVIEKISEESFSNLILFEDAADELFKLFEKIKSKNVKINQGEVYDFFNQLFAKISYFNEDIAKAPIQIISTIEARLLNFDLVIISSLNYGEFPQNEADNWLGRKIRKDLGIDLSNKKYGQNSYDFCNYLANKSVILTRCKTRNQAPLMPSAFILRLEILCKKINFEIKNSVKYFDLLSKINPYEANKAKFVRRNEIANPPLEFRPEKLAITDIAKLISDPYQIYAKKILQLKELNKLDYEPEFREFGSFIHKALEEFVKNKESVESFLLKAKIIFNKYFISENSQLIWWPKFENIFRNFVEENKALEPSDDYVEVETEIAIEGLKIVGKIDRISIFNNNEIKIFDYKTGQIPAVKNILSGIEPQLTISALMISLNFLENKFKGKKISSLNYWKLSSVGESEIKEIIKNDEEIAIAISSAKTGLAKIARYFQDGKNGYKIADDLEGRHEYSHLTRNF